VKNDSKVDDTRSLRYQAQMQAKSYEVGGDKRFLHARSRFNVGKHQWGLRPLA